MGCFCLNPIHLKFSFHFASLMAGHTCRPALDTQSACNTSFKAVKLVHAPEDYGCSRLRYRPLSNASRRHERVLTNQRVDLWRSHYAQLDVAPRDRSQNGEHDVRRQA
jgi:hypothetical protein